MVEFLMENPQAAAYLVTGLVSIVGLLTTMLGWFITRTLSKIDANQTKLFDMFRELAVDVALLKGRIERGSGNG